MIKQESFLCLLFYNKKLSRGRDASATETRERLRVDALPAPEKQAYYRDMEAQRYQCSVIKTGWYEGRAEGRAEVRQEERQSNARNLKQLGVSPEIIAKATGVSLEEIADL